MQKLFQNPYQIVTDELSYEISVMYLKLKTAAFSLNGLATAQPAIHLEDFRSVSMKILLKSTNQRPIPGS